MGETTGQSVINLAGEIEVTTPQRSTDITMSQTIDGIEVKATEYTIPHANSASPFSVPLNLSTGILEALVVHLECEQPLVLIITGKDTTAPGPIRLGIKGHMLFTLWPGEGIISISVINNDTVNDANLAVSVGALANPTDQPDYWFPTSP